MTASMRICYERARATDFNSDNTKGRQGEPTYDCCFRNEQQSFKEQGESCSRRPLNLLQERQGPLVLAL